MRKPFENSESHDVFPPFVLVRSKLAQSTAPAHVGASRRSMVYSVSVFPDSDGPSDPRVKREARTLVFDGFPDDPPFTVEEFAPSPTDVRRALVARRASADSSILDTGSDTGSDTRSDSGSDRAAVAANAAAPTPSPVEDALDAGIVKVEVPAPRTQSHHSAVPERDRAEQTPSSDQTPLPPDQEPDQVLETSREETDKRAKRQRVARGETAPSRRSEGAPSEHADAPPGPLPATFPSGRKRPTVSLNELADDPTAAITIEPKAHRVPEPYWHRTLLEPRASRASPAPTPPRAKAKAKVKRKRRGDQISAGAARNDELLTGCADSRPPPVRAPPSAASGGSPGATRALASMAQVRRSTCTARADDDLPSPPPPPPVGFEPTGSSAPGFWASRASDAIQSAKALLDGGCISREEYETVKREWLRRILWEG